MPNAPISADSHIVEPPNCYVDYIEPRYRDMIADCLSQGPTAIAVARLKPGWQPNYHGRPELYEVAGAGRIISHLRQRDGTYDIQLEGVARVRLQELPAERSYRRAAASVLQDCAPEGGLPARELSTLLTLASQIVQLVQRENPVARMQLLASLDDQLACVIAGMWPDPADSDANTAWVRGYYDAIAPHSEPGGYVNFLADDDAARRPASYGASYERLREVKRRYDPTNVFRRNQNIEP